jgi:spectinomycin phosphotransferase
MVLTIVAGLQTYHPLMFAEPADLDHAELVAVLHGGWGVSAAALRYEAVGFGTHHYLAQDGDGRRWFVNVDELAAKSWIADDPSHAMEALARALRSATALREAGLEFVHAPVTRRDGDVIGPLGDAYAVSLYAYIDGTSNEFGEFGSEDERRLVLNALGRMHLASARVPSDIPRRDTLRIPLRQRFFEHLDDLRSNWTGGPFSEPARALLGDRATAVREMFARYDQLADAVRAEDRAWVVTHGEPHGGNVMRTKDGGLRLVDWDTVAVGPRERDLWMVEPKDDDDWDAYTSGGGSSEISRGALELYNLWWSLSEITGYTDALRAPHTDDANTRPAWENLQTYLP